MKKLLSSHASIMGLFSCLVLILAIPLVIFISQERQDIRQRAAVFQPTPDLLAPQKGYGFVSGYVYLDQNQDGQRNYAEKAAIGIPLKITQTNKNAVKTYQTQDLITALVTDENGYFKYSFSSPQSAPAPLNRDEASIDPELVEGLTFILQLDLPGDYKTINTNPRVLTNVTNETKEIIEFGIFPINSTSPVNIPVSTQPTIFQYNPTTSSAPPLGPTYTSPYIINGE